MRKMKFTNYILLLSFSIICFSCGKNSMDADLTGKPDKIVENETGSLVCSINCKMWCILPFYPSGMPVNTMDIYLIEKAAEHDVNFMEGKTVQFSGLCYQVAPSQVNSLLGPDFEGFNVYYIAVSELTDLTPAPEPDYSCDPTATMNPDFKIENDFVAKKMIIGKWAQIGKVRISDHEIVWNEPDITSYVEFFPDGRYNWAKQQEDRGFQYIISDTYLNRYMHSCDCGYFLDKYTFINQDTLRLDYSKGCVADIATDWLLISFFKRISN